SPETPDLIPQFRMEYLEFDRIIAYYQSVFGSANVLALPYEALLEKPYIHLRQIHKFSGADPALEKTIDTLPVLRRINKGQSLAWLYWLRWQNKYIYKTSYDRFGFIETTNDLLMRRISKSKKSNLPK